MIHRTGSGWLLGLLGLLVALGSTARGEPAEVPEASRGGHETVATAPAPLEDEARALEALHQETHVRRLRLTGAVLGWGAASTLAGALLMIPDAQNQAIRVAGGATLAFGAIDVAIGALGLVGLRAAERTFAAGAAERRTPQGLRAARLKLATAERREAIAYALNLGLDVAYLAGGLVAVGVSRLGVSDPERWLSAGLATTVQALFLLGIDLVGVLTATGAQSRILEAWAKTGVVLRPVVAPTVGGLTVGAVGRF